MHNKVYPLNDSFKQSLKHIDSTILANRLIGGLRNRFELTSIQFEMVLAMANNRQPMSAADFNNHYLFKDYTEAFFVRQLELLEEKKTITNYGSSTNSFFYSLDPTISDLIKSITLKDLVATKVVDYEQAIPLADAVLSYLQNTAVKFENIASPFTHTSHHEEKKSRPRLLKRMLKAVRI